jgi:hypothetical protein
MDCLGVSSADAVLIVFNEEQRSVATALELAAGARAGRITRLEFAATSGMARNHRRSGRRHGCGPM